MGQPATRSSSGWTRSAEARGPARISVGAAVIPQDKRVYKIRDSKMLTATEREAMFDRIAVVVRHVGGRSRVADRVRHARHVRRATARGRPGARAASDSRRIRTASCSTASGTSSAAARRSSW